MQRIGIMLGVAIPLAAADIYVKATVRTEPWAYHQRSIGWLLLSLALLSGIVAIASVPSLLAAPAAGILAAGVLGNSLSAAWNGMYVPNPFLVTRDQAAIAFNLADIWVLAGISSLVCVLGVWLVRNRHLVPAAAEIRTQRAAAFRRLFDTDRL